MSTSFIDCYRTSNIKVLLSQWNIACKKRWGQNFLINEQSCEHIAGDIHKIISQQCALLNISSVKETVIWEIGAGFGALTGKLLSICSPLSLVLFEIDYGLVRALTHYINTHELSSVHIVQGDAEKRVHHYSDSPSPIIICGNLPYISGVRILLSCNRLSLIHGHYIPFCVMIQKEVAERLMAPVGTKQYGISSVLLQAHYDIQILRHIPSQYFYPQPNVESVICSLIPRQDDPLLTKNQLDTFQSIVKISFSQRRKKLRNTLLPFLESKHIPDVELLCQQADITLDDRAEMITCQQFMQLAHRVSIYNESSSTTIDHDN